MVVKNGQRVKSRVPLRRARPEAIFAAGLAFMLLSQLSYLFGFMVTPPGHRFL